MTEYRIIGIDLAKTKFHLVALDNSLKIVLKKPIHRKDFFAKLTQDFPTPQTFAFEACGGSHYMAQQLQALGHRVIVLKPKDVKIYAKARQKNDTNDALAICKAALDPHLKHVRPKTRDQQEVSYLHKSRQNVIQQRIQRSNSLMTSLQEFGYIAQEGKTKFAKKCEEHILEAFDQGFITQTVYLQMGEDCAEIKVLLQREKELDKKIALGNKTCEEAKRLESIPGIGSINASLLSNKSMSEYESAKDFASSLGIVPKQNTTGGVIRLGSITKQGDRYARTMLIQGGRSVVMRLSKPNVPQDELYQFAERLRRKGKPFNVVCVAVANKLARIAYACVMKKQAYSTVKP